jgi:hypothetical protein
MGVARDDQVILQLRSGVKGNADKAGKFSLAPLARTFHDVRRHRHCRSQHLIPQSAVIGPVNSDSNTTNVEP